MLGKRRRNLFGGLAAGLALLLVVGVGAVPGRATQDGGAGAGAEGSGAASAEAEAGQDDAGSGGDAGGSFESATPVAPRGAYQGRLEAGDTDDFFRFHLHRRESMSVTVTWDGPETDLHEPVVLLDPNGVPVEGGVEELGMSSTTSSAMTGGTQQFRVGVHHAVVEGDYRLQLSAKVVKGLPYSLCFMNCEGPVDAPIWFIFGGSLPDPMTRVLLIPPSHGDLGNPAGPTVVDYINATLRGMWRWEEVLHRFADDYPQFSYLKKIKVDIEVFSGPPELADPVGYDVVVGYVAAGPVFRGIANEYPLGAALGGDIRWSGRTILLSLFGSSPRTGQAAYDFPEVNDLEGVTMHEFGHTFGLGHTLTWHPQHGPDLMNSPATFVYGDGFAGGDGGERTALECFSSLDLYGMAELYRWLPSGWFQQTWGEVRLPPEIPYKLYC